MLQTRDIVRKVRTWQQRLGILDYEVIFKAGTDTPDGIHARIWVSHDYKYADITLADGWEYIYEQVIEQKIVHELLHIIWHRARRAFEATEIHLGHLAYSAFFTSFESAEETAVESLAAALVDGWGLA